MVESLFIVVMMATTLMVMDAVEIAKLKLGTLVLVDPLMDLITASTQSLIELQSNKLVKCVFPQALSLT